MVLTIGYWLVVAIWIGLAADQRYWTARDSLHSFDVTIGSQTVSVVAESESEMIRTMEQLCGPLSPSTSAETAPGKEFESLDELIVAAQQATDQKMRAIEIACEGKLADRRVIGNEHNQALQSAAISAGHQLIQALAFFITGVILIFAFLWVIKGFRAK